MGAPAIAVVRSGDLRLRSKMPFWSPSPQIDAPFAFDAADAGAACIDAGAASKMAKGSLLWLPCCCCCWWWWLVWNAVCMLPKGSTGAEAVWKGSTAAAAVVVAVVIAGGAASKAENSAKELVGPGAAVLGTANGSTDCTGAGATWNVLAVVVAANPGGGGAIIVTCGPAPVGGGASATGADIDCGGADTELLIWNRVWPAFLPDECANNASLSLMPDALGVAPAPKSAAKKLS